MSKGITQKNIICALILQVTTIVSGLIIPRIILGLFGSEVNGLISSVTQFLSYIQLVEGGLGGVVMAALYKPLNEGEQEAVSVIVKTSASFFRTIGFIYLGYLVIVAFLYPIFIDTGFDYKYSILLILVLGIRLIVQYFLSITYQWLLKADRKVYVVTLTQALTNVLNVAFVILSAHFFRDILLIKLCSAFVFLIQPVVFLLYVKKLYGLNENVKPDKTALGQRWVAFGINLAYFIHTNTDIVILTIFATLYDVSVYSVYFLVIAALKGIVSAVSNAFAPSFGKALAVGEKEAVSKSFDQFECFVQLFAFVLFACGAVLIVPFVMLYTKGVQDADYYQPVFAILIISAELIYCLREPFVQATNAAGMFKETSIHAYIEAGINIIVSIVLVFRLGITGVAIGTLLAMLYRMIAQVIIVNKRILKQPAWKSFLRIAALSVVMLVTYFLFTRFGPQSIDTWGRWIKYGCVVFVMVSVVAALLGMAMYREMRRKIFH